MKHILAAIDFSDISDPVADAAETLALALGAKLSFLHIAAPDPDFVGLEAGPQSVRDNRAARLKSHRATLGKMAEQARQRGLEATATLREGQTIAELLGEADATRAEMVVMGSHGHGALYNLVVGSVTQGVLKGTSVPVLVVPSRKQ